MTHRTKRIYYGPAGNETSIWWTVRVDDARKPVSINGSILHALRGYQGMTVGCGLSNMAIDKINAKAFPHPVHLASFTKSTALIVDKLKKDGSPAHAVMYAHSYGHITDRNDDNTLKKLVKENPSLIERSFMLRPPRKQQEGRSHSGTSGSKRKSGQSFVPRGALARAVKAGRVGRNVAKHLMDVAASGNSAA
jgi:hypothetical protein